MIDWLLAKGDVMRPFGELDVLPYYACVAKSISSFVGKRELASKILIPKGPSLLKRGTMLPPLTAAELSTGFNEKTIELRRKTMDEAGDLGPLKRKIWQYFFRRKLCDLFYATNFEGAKNPLSRIFFDIDRGEGVKLSDAAHAARSLAVCLKSDDSFVKESGMGETFIMYTGNSFHVYAMLKKPKSGKFYDERIGLSVKAQSHFAGKWLGEIRKETEKKVIFGHEKVKGAITIDPSQTPGGKLARCPFSLHMKDAQSIDGVAVPVNEEALSEKRTCEELKEWNPENVLENIKILSRLLPVEYK